VHEMMQGYFEQFEGRAGGRRNFLILPDYPTEEDVEAIAKAFKMTGLSDRTTWPVKDGQGNTIKVEKLTTLEYLGRIVHEPGRIRSLFEDLQQAKKEAEDLKQSLKIEHVKAVRDEED